ncbi:IQ-DOMAIN 1 protein [Nymphaea thermarum]|nr:IQ-DOMAIN 1 protein [Nymphaea thermarum]
MPPDRSSSTILQISTQPPPCEEATADLAKLSLPLFSSYPIMQKPTPSNHSKGFKWRHHKSKGSKRFSITASNSNADVANLYTEDKAAILIQTAFRGFLARKTYRQLKGLERLQFLKQRLFIQKQTTSTLSYLQLLNKIQAQVHDRRRSMLAETRNKQKKRDHQLKLEAKLHEIEVEWCSGSESMEEILARVHEREAASVKRERALAYAFSHQVVLRSHFFILCASDWRASNRHSPGKGGYDLRKDDWGWNWTENFLMAWQFENRITRPVTSVTPKSVQSKEDSKRTSTLSSKVSIQADSHSNDGKVPSNRPDSAVVKKLFSENSPNREASETSQDVEATTKPEHSTLILAESIN